MATQVPSPERIQKYPWGAITFILFSVCITLVFLLVNRPTCDSKDWKKAYEDERERNNQLTTSLLVNKGVIEKLKASKDTSKIIEHENIN